MCVAVQDAHIVSRSALDAWWSHSSLPWLLFSVTENGFAVKDENSMTLEQALHDEPRVQYYRGVTQSLVNAVVEDGVDVRAYFAWSTSPHCIPPVCYSTLLIRPRCRFA